MPTPQRKTYAINEVYRSIQGEGVRCGTVNVFVRFAGCNLACDVRSGPRSPGGFACDTEFVSSVKRTSKQLLQWCDVVAGQCRSIILTGGEPALSLDRELLEALSTQFSHIAIETNGTHDLTPFDDLIHWVTLSPKVAEHAIKQLRAAEIKYVRGFGQAIPKTNVVAKHYLISPAFDGTDLDYETLEWCKKLVTANPEWRLSVQMHKFIKAR